MNQINLKRKESQVHQLVASIIQNDLTNVNIIDPVVMDVKLSSDLSVLKVYVNLSENVQKGIIALNSSASYVRKILAKSLNWRKAPEVRFFIDEVSATGSAIDAILRKIKEEN
ncbi:30S ribosome-binding factor RbfA [Mycoplasmopsis felis]|uniref:30S ribosome-binding factor RbfA n=1 Tax=Mycoplasmopsis felis TaxID=33923 RepID=UPI002AFFFC71|nr:30S ribosome-binding factor RbfA [Mycoplasmopsis felis]WQQ10199.1 30S ribosome-binding factor RbfA [Mycoplasmopsis felis]WQQ11050.1 30S ribosome-binding factor RbfA [Mycoplasmopsis felis]WRX06522.1 30S ribosome-binding factor RbfA [Mycoplasmopsis felis]